MCADGKALQLENRQRVIITVIDEPKVIEEKADGAGQVAEVGK